MKRITVFGVLLALSLTAVCSKDIPSQACLKAFDGFVSVFDGCNSYFCVDQGPDNEPTINRTLRYCTIYSDPDAVCVAGKPRSFIYDESMICYCTMSGKRVCGRMTEAETCTAALPDATKCQCLPGNLVRCSFEAAQS